VCATHGNKEDCKSIVIGVGAFSQWGRIQANLDQEDVNTPLQDKLEDMVTTKLRGLARSLALCFASPPRSLPTCFSCAHG
jgi:hypothetical protein